MNLEDYGWAYIFKGEVKPLLRKAYTIPLKTFAQQIIAAKKQNLPQTLHFKYHSKYLLSVDLPPSGEMGLYMPYNPKKYARFNDDLTVKQALQMVHNVY